MRAFAMLDGVRRGPTTVTEPDGKPPAFVQTERIGPFLGGSIEVIEGRGHDDVAKGSYTLHSHAQGRVGDFAFVATGDGYRWGDPPPTGSLRYVATVRDGELQEVGDLNRDGREPVRVFEMRLRRVGDTDWPVAGAVAPK